jgi:ATP-binding cassette subfamily F protein 3
MKYTGTIVFVSHDRYFIDKLATRVFEIGDGKVEIYPGNYEDYLWRKQGGPASEPTLKDVPGATRSKSNSTPNQGAPLLAAVARSGNHTASDQKDGNNGTAASPDVSKKRLNPIKRKQLEDRVHELEEEISHVEADIAHCETALQNYVNAEENQRQSRELDEHKASHAELIKEWEELAEALQSDS